MMTHNENMIEQALVDFCRTQDKPPLPELWSAGFEVSLRSVGMMSRQHIQAWFCGLATAWKHGMWWSYHTGYLTLHGTTGEKPMFDRLTDVVLWLNSLEPEIEPGRFSSKNLTLLTTPTDAYCLCPKTN